MPFINAKVSLTLEEKQKEALKIAFGQIITTIPGKSEDYLMVGIEDNYDLYMAGSKLDKGAFIEIKLFGAAEKEDLEKVTDKVCESLDKLLAIPGKYVYVTYQSINDWGWNGFNF